MKYILLTTLILLSNFTFAQNEPNIIVIFTDDLGYGDLACYGHPSIQTPNLDKMAAQGIRFTQFYSAASVCTPSRAALLTGRYPVRTGMVKGMIPGDVLFPNDKTGLPHSEITIAELLKQKKYKTAIIGKWHLGHLPHYLPINHGFDYYYGIPYSNDMDHVGAKEGNPPYWNIPLIKDTTIIERPAVQSTLTKRYTHEAINFIQSNKDKPFFMYLAHTMPHVPLFSSDNFTNSSKAGRYGDVIEEIDWSVGKILDELKSLGIDQNTLVVFTSDNGPWLVQKSNGGTAGLLREGKGTTWEGGMRVPMIAWWPGTIPQGTTSYQVASTLDLLPTFAEISQTNKPDDIDGVSILPILKGQEIKARDFFAYHRYGKIYAVRYGPWKAHYITQSAYPTKAPKYHNPPLLYNLEVDPSEKYNIADNHKEIIAKIDNWKVNHQSTLKTEKIPSIEAEDLVDKVEVNGGKIRIQNMENFPSKWSGNRQLWWVEGKPGDKIDLKINVKKAGKKELYGFFTRGKDYGIIKVKVNERDTGVLIDCYNNNVETTGAVPLGIFDFHKVKNTVTLEIIGKDYRSAGYSNGYLVGIDGFLIQ